MLLQRSFLTALQRPLEQRPPAPVTVLLVAHPDDEVLGVGGQLEWLAAALHVVHLTPGVPITLDPEQRAIHPSAEAYGACRQSELDSVLSRAGIRKERRHRLGGADQGCARMLSGLTCELRDLLRRLTPDVLLTHPYEGGHPDHDAAAFVAQAACRLLARPPTRLEFTSYHGRDGQFECAAFLPDQDQGIPAYLDDVQRRFKRALLAEYVSQQRTLAQFTPDAERFRPAPEYDFSKPPHRPPVHYDMYPWGMDTATFLHLAVEAAAALTHLAEPAWR
jgi:LmbE family N-acetylglucosaminyl deacetylase